MALKQIRRFLSELRRRRVYRVAVVYAVAAWVLLQLGDILVEPLQLPEWTMALVILILALGFPLALILTWAFEITPEGIRRTQPAAAERETPHDAGGLSAGQAAGYVAAGILIAFVGLEFYGYLRDSPGGDATAATDGAAGIHGQLSLKQLTFVSAVDEFPAWSPDGGQIAFSRELDGFLNLFVRNVESGSERQVTNTNADDIQPAWSPDGNFLLFVRANRPHGKINLSDTGGYYSDGDVWMLDLTTLSASKLIEAAYNPAFSPDGRWIAVDASWAGPRRLWVVDERGRNPHQVSTDTSESIVHTSPSWSPDGSRLAFQHIDGTQRDIRIVDRASEEITWVTRDHFFNVGPRWSPNGNFIYFSSYRGGGLNIWRTRLAGDGISATRFEQITTGAGHDLNVSISPGGESIAFTVLGINANIWMLPVSPDSGHPTGPPQPLIESTREDSRGALSPDGRTIAFSSDRSGHMNIWVYSIDGASYRQLTFGPGGDYQANWSPDGRSIAFFSSRSGNLDIWTVDVALGTLRQLTDGPTSDINPFYSPDGNYIAFHSDQSGRDEPWVMRSDGSNARKLAPILSGGHFLRWTRDGTRVVFASSQASPRGLWTAPRTDGEPSFLLNPAGGGHISFSPDYTLIADVIDHKVLWITPMDGSEPYEIFEFEDPEVRIDYPVWSPDGSMIVFDHLRPAGGNIWLAEGLR